MVIEDTEISTARIFESPVLNNLRPLFGAYRALLLMSCVLPFLYLSAPLMVVQIMQRVFVSRSETTLFVLASVAFFLLITSVLIDWARQQALSRVGIGIDERLSGLLFDAVYRTRQASAGRSLALINDFELVRNALSTNSVAAIFDAFWSPVFIAVLFVVHWVFGLFALFTILLSAALSVLNYLVGRAAMKRAGEIQTLSNEFALAVGRNAETIRALGMLPRLQQRWHDLHHKVIAWQASGRQGAIVIAAVVRFVRTSQYVTIYTIGTILFLEEQVTQPAIFLSLIVMLRTLGPLDQVISSWPTYASFLSSLGRLDEVMREAERRPSKLSLPDLAGPLVASRVFVSAPGGDKPILTDISFNLGQGRTLGVVGPSGAGKSCLGRVLVGAWRPLRGTVAVGDYDLSHWDEDELGRRIGYMPQDIELLPGTVAENIARFEPSAEANAVIAAAQMTGILDFVRTLPEGFNTRLGAGGHVLSAGQRNRIALARAMYGDPSLVVLDEPNSNLDGAAEQALMTMVQKLQARQVTVVIITHKLNILNCCDDILVLNAGAVQAFGAREQIVDRIPRLRAPPNLTVIEGSVGDRRS